MRHHHWWQRRVHHASWRPLKVQTYGPQQRKGDTCLNLVVVLVVLVVLVVQMTNDTACQSRRVREMQLIRVAEHLGASSRRPRHPFSALMAGEPLAVFLCTRPQKAFPSHHELQLRRPPQFSARLDPMTMMVMSPYRYTSHFSLRHLSLNLNRE